MHVTSVGPGVASSADAGLARCCRSSEITSTEVRHGVMLEVSPDVFNGVELGSVGRQILQRRWRPAESIEGTLGPASSGVPAGDPRRSAVSCRSSLLQRLEELHDLRALGSNRGRSESRSARTRPRAITESCFQLKLYCSTGVWPFGAPQVRTRQGLSDKPDSSMKTITRPCRAAIFFFYRPPFSFQVRMFSSFRRFARYVLRGAARSNPDAGSLSPVIEDFARTLHFEALL